MVRPERFELPPRGLRVPCSDQTELRARGAAGRSRTRNVVRLKGGCLPVRPRRHAWWRYRVSNPDRRAANAMLCQLSYIPSGVALLERLVHPTCHNANTPPPATPLVSGPGDPPARPARQDPPRRLSRRPVVTDDGRHRRFGPWAGTSQTCEAPCACPRGSEQPPTQGMSAADDLHWRRAAAKSWRSRGEAAGCEFPPR
jgi:hypothetical protein